MKQKLKKLKRLFGSTLAGLLLFACQVDKDLTNENLYEKNGTIMHKKFEELIQETEFKTAFDKINKPKKGFSNKGNASSRTVMEQEYGFSIMSEIPANQITIDSTTSYTLLVKRDNQTPNIFENLIISIDKKQTITAYLIKFESSVSFFDLPYNPTTFTGTKTVTPITYNASPVYSLFNDVCRTVVEWYCYGPGHHMSSEGCSMGFSISTTTCSGNDGGSGGTAGTGVPSTSDPRGGGGTSNTNTVVTAPVISVPKVEAPKKDPCPTLIPLMAEPKINLAINFLKPKTQTKSEFGYAVTKGWDSTGTNIVVNTEFVAGTNSNAVIETGAYIMGSLHNHTIDGGAIPSISDVDWLMHCEQDNTNANSDTAFAIVLVRDLQVQGSTFTYAITINDLEALQAQMALNFALPDVLEVPLMKDKIDILLKLQAEAFKNALTNDALEKKFLEYFSKYGVNLSKFDPATNKWNNLRLQNPFNPNLPNTPNTVISEPCN